MMTSCYFVPHTKSYQTKLRSSSIIPVTPDSLKLTTLRLIFFFRNVRHFWKFYWKRVSLRRQKTETLNLFLSLSCAQEFLRVDDNHEILLVQSPFPKRPSLQILKSLVQNIENNSKIQFIKTQYTNI